MADPRTQTRIFVLLTLTALALWTGIAWATVGGRATVNSVFGWAFSWPWMG